MREEGYRDVDAQRHFISGMMKGVPVVDKPDTYGERAVLKRFAGDFTEVLQQRERERERARERAHA
jgi:hypothetical protein